MMPPSVTAIPLPAGSVRLVDGRVLRYDGHKTWPHVGPDGATQEQHYWLGPDGMRVVGSIDTIPERGWSLLHVSVSYRHHAPTWADLHLVKRAFFGDDRDAMQLLPKESDYVNAHAHTYHIWQMPFDWGIQ